MNPPSNIGGYDLDHPTTGTAVYTLQPHGPIDPETNNSLGLRVCLHVTGFHDSPRDSRSTVRLITGHFGQNTGREFHRVELPRRCIRLWREAVEECVDYAHEEGLIT